MGERGKGGEGGGMGEDQGGYQPRGRRGNKNKLAKEAGESTRKQRS